MCEELQERVDSTTIPKLEKMAIWVKHLSDEFASHSLKNRDLELEFEAKETIVKQMEQRVLDSEGEKQELEI